MKEPNTIQKLWIIGCVDCQMNPQTEFKVQEFIPNPFLKQKNGGFTFKEILEVP